ncbi:MAG: class I SAM-dependent methyltransferase [Desulfobacterales bacterium]|nr:class I SAM-dependent methyltransferase [Desulfobacterales bacterium]
MLDYGVIPIADALSKSAHDHQHQAPLALHYCHPCSLLQLGSHLEPRSIFNNRYPYFSSAINSLVERMQQLATQLVHTYELDSDSRVVEIASNDGYLLQHFTALGIPVQGIEPSQRQSELAKKNGIQTECVFFNSKVSAQLKDTHGSADLIIANNVVAHVPEVSDFISAIASLLKDSGTAVFEFHYAVRMIEDCQFDTLYHQHIYYYTLSSFTRLLGRHGLSVSSVEPIESYGGSLRVHANRPSQADNSVQNMLESEASLFEASTLEQFAKHAKEKSLAIRAAILQIKDNGKHIVGYGAAAKSSTLLGVCDIGSQHLDYVVDQNPHKHGLFMPASSLQIHPVSMLESNTPDYILILAWNYAEEIMQQLAWFKAQGGHFIVPSPTLAIH